MLPANSVGNTERLPLPPCFGSISASGMKKAQILRMKAMLPKEGFVRLQCDHHVGKIDGQYISICCHHPIHHINPD